MSVARAKLPSVAEGTRPIMAEAPVVAAHFLGTTAVFVLGEEALLLTPADGKPRRVAIHGGAVLCSDADLNAVLTGGDDGRVVATDAQGKTTEIAADARRRWIDHVRIGPRGAHAWSAGKQAFARSAESAEHVLEVASTVGGLAFAPKGFRLAVSHYNGVSLWFPNATAAPEVLSAKGSHLAIMFSPDGRFVISAMQEPTLHGWRLADRKEMRMSGYNERVHSLAWTSDGKWLASGGADAVVLWPFEGKDGPLGKAPRLLARADAQAHTVACHPQQGIVAAGYADGLILLVRIEDGAEILARKPTGVPIGALAWSERGSLLAFGDEDGAAGIIDLR